ncbi:HAD family hydrolase [Ectobacillus polymachus]|uniref:HAD family hydrolase n=1 Tax=Ectobacillus polymachus TaxID=1508806 RepID=UPI003A89DD7F
MNHYNVILFDLDGTISNPKVGIVTSIQYALNKMGITESDTKKLELFIGPPLKDSFAAYYGFKDEKNNQAIQYYREYFAKQGLFENELYSGFLDLLEDLKQQGKKVFVATSKPTVFATRILEYFRIDHYFDGVVGSELDGTRTSKAEIIEYIINKYDLNQDSMVMIGDRKYDIVGAKENHIASIAVTYGYGTLEELTAASPSYIVHSVKELHALLTT